MDPKVLLRYNSVCLERLNTKSTLTIQLPFPMSFEVLYSYMERDYSGWIIKSVNI